MFEKFDRHSWLWTRLAEVRSCLIWTVDLETYLLNFLHMLGYPYPLLWVQIEHLHNPLLHYLLIEWPWIFIIKHLLLVFEFLTIPPLLGSHVLYESVSCKALLHLLSTNFRPPFIIDLNWLYGLSSNHECAFMQNVTEAACTNVSCTTISCKSTISISIDNILFCTV